MLNPLAAAIVVYSSLTTKSGSAEGMCAAKTTIDREADRLVSVMLTDVRVTASFRAALFSACGRAGSTMNEFLIKAAAEKLAADGYGFTGVFEPGDMASKAAPDPFAGDQDRTSIAFNGTFVTKAEKAAAARLFPVTALLGAAYIALNDFLTYMRGGESVIGDFIQALADFLGSDPDKVARVLGDMATGAAGIAGAAAGVLMFSGALKTLAGAVGLFGTGAAAGGSKNLLKLLGLGAAVWGGIESLTNPSEQLKEAPRLKLGVDDAIRWLLGTDQPRDSGHPYKNPPIQSGAARSAQEQSRQFNAFAGFEDRMNGGGVVVAAASLAWLKNAFSSITAKLDNPAFVDNPMFQKGLENLQANLAATQPAAAAAAVSTTMTDNRQYPVTINSTVNQTVTQATQAPAAAAQATSQAVGRAASARDSTRLYNE